MAITRSGQITVTTAGTAVPGPAMPGGSSQSHQFALKGHPDNTVPVWMGDSGEGDVTEDDGFPLDAAELIVVEAGSLADFMFGATADGQKVCWLLL